MARIPNERQLQVARIFEAAHRDRCDAPTIAHITKHLRAPNSRSGWSAIQSLLRKGWLEIQPNTYREKSGSKERYRLTDHAFRQLAILNELCVSA